MRLVRVAAAAVASVAVLVACSDGETANDTLPSTSTSASADPSETLQPLGPPDFPVPTEAREPTPDGAVKALEYYLDLIQRQSTKDGGPLRELSNDCTFCSFLADRADADAAAGYVYKGGIISTDDLRLPATDGIVAEFAFSASQTAVEVLDLNGQPVAGRGQEAVSDISAAAAMSWDASIKAWLMTQLSFG